MAKKKGFFGTVGRLLGSIPVVGKAKKAGKAVKKKVKAVKKKAKKTVKKVKKKLKKKVGKVFTKARKLKNNLSKTKLVKKVKRTVKKVVVKTKKVVKKAKAVVKSAKKQTKKVVQQVKQTAKKTVQQTKQVVKAVNKQVKTVVKAVKSAEILPVVSTVVDFIPVAGNVKSGFEAAFGFDPITLNKLSKADRLIATAGIIGGPVVKGLKHGGKAVKQVVSNGKPLPNPTQLTASIGKIKGLEKVKNVLSPSKAKEIATKAYDDYVKSPLTKGYESAKKYVKQVGDLNTPFSYQMATPYGNIKIPKTVNEVTQDLKQSAVQMVKQLDEAIGGKVKGTGQRENQKLNRKSEQQAKGTGNPRYESGVATESFDFRNSLATQKKLMYQNGDIGIIPQEVRDKLAGREFRSFDEFRGELWKEVGNSSFAEGFNKANQSLMNQGFAPRAPKNGHYKSLNTYILHHKQPIEKGGGVYDLDNLIIVSPRMHQEILDRSYHFGKKGASLRNHYRR